MVPLQINRQMEIETTLLRAKVLITIRLCFCCRLLSESDSCWLILHAIRSSFIHASGMVGLVSDK